MNQYIQQIYRERCEAAETAANRVRERHQAILNRWREMAQKGVLYAQAERQADSNALKEAEEQFRLVLSGVYELEDEDRAQ